LRGLAFDASSQVRVHRSLRSNSVSSASPRAVHAISRKRCSSFASSDGSPAKGAASVITRSRWGTLFFRLPPSSASTHTTVEGAAACHLAPRGPVITPVIGTASPIGTSAIVRTFSPVRDQTSMSFGKSSRGTRRENGRLVRLTRKKRPSGDGAGSSIMPGLPIGVTLPLAGSIRASWLVR
jgi:hypothetical protein